MSSTPISSEFHQPESLFARAQAGDQQAWRTLFAECYPKVRRVIRNRLNTRLRRYVDSTDIVNDVFGDLAAKASSFRFGSVDEVRHFLIDAARKRVIDEYRRQTTRKRDTRLERPLAGTAAGEEDAWTLSSGEPTPSQHAVAREVDERLRAVPDDEEGRRVIELRGQHYSNEEISGLLGWSTRKVQRFLEQLRPIFLN